MINVASNNLITKVNYLEILNHYLFGEQNKQVFVLTLLFIIREIKNIRSKNQSYDTNIYNILINK